MSFENYKIALRDLFEKQKNCDVAFSCDDPTSKTGKSTIMAHKLILSTASEVFDTMFNGEAAKHEKLKDKEDPFSIDDIELPAFKLFLSFIYTKIVEFETPETAAEFYYAAHKYNVLAALEYIKTYMLKQANSENAVVFYEIACLYENQKLKDACLKVFLRDTMDVFNNPNFLRADPKTIEAIFKLNGLKISSEMQLIYALERYIDYNQTDISDIIEKVRPALNHIRLSAPRIALYVKNIQCGKTCYVRKKNYLHKRKYDWKKIATAGLAACILTYAVFKNFSYGLVRREAFF